jgi:hypothetical protein
MRPFATLRTARHFRTLLLGTTAALAASSAIPTTAAAAPVIAARVSAPTTAKATHALAPQAASALETLSQNVSHMSDPRALESAVSAYYAYQAAHPNEIKTPYLYFVDFGQSESAQRGYVFDMQNLKVVDGPFTVAQGSGSGAGVPARFSNEARSRSTSLGLYVTGNTYAFTGHSGGQPYNSVAVRLIGKSQGFNDNAFARGVVAHGAPYVTPNRAGKSQGCPAMERDRAERLLPKLANGSVVFLFAPNGNWMARDQWVNAHAN